MTSWSVKDAAAGDAEACAAIYAPYVTDTAISFETDPPTPDEMVERIAAAQRKHAWLVLTGTLAGDAGAAGDEGVLADDRVLGYAYGGPFRTRAAYRFSCEVSVYLEPGRRRTGAGRVLYEALLARLSERGFTTAVAGMTLPNDASVGLHRALGFEPVGTLHAVGWKHGSWWDVAMMQRTLS